MRAVRANDSSTSRVASVDASSQTISSSGGRVCWAMLSNCAGRNSAPLKVHSATDIRMRVILTRHLIRGPMRRLKDFALLNAFFRCETEARLGLIASRNHRRDIFADCRAVFETVTGAAADEPDVL